MARTRVTAALPATAGELVQGLLDGEPCLVSCPIGWFAYAEVTVTADRTWAVPPRYPKVQQAIRLLSQQPGFPPVGGRVEMRTRIPRGRGYGSSTADVAAALYAAAHAVGRPLPPPAVARLAVQVEPTDSTVFPGLALFAHRTAAFWETLGPAPRLTLIVLDPGGQVDTETYNRRVPPEALRPLAPYHREAFQMLVEGLTRQDWETVGQAATLSALTHQHVLPNPWVEKALQWAREIAALGICRAHSGTLVGLICDPAVVDVPEAVAFLRQHLPPDVSLRAWPMTDGGPRIIQEGERCAEVPQRPSQSTR